MTGPMIRKGKKGFRMNTKYLTSFLTVVEEGSINKAASRLFLSPSALMKQLNSIEEETSTKLLLRGKKGVELTEAGQMFYQGIRKIHPEFVKLVRETKELGRRNAKGICVGSWSVACHSILPPIINYYQMRHPDAELSFRNVSGIYEMQRALEQKEIDVTFSFGGKSRETARLDYMTIAEEDVMLLIPQGCELEVKREYVLEDFHGRTLVVTDGTISGWFERFNSYVEKKHPAIRLYKTRENESGLMEMQKLSAPCVASRSIVPRDNRYVMAPLRLPQDYPEQKISIDLVCRSRKEPIVQEFTASAEEASRFIWYNG